MKGRLLAPIATIALAACVAASTSAAQPARELHGAADAFAAGGIALAWGVLRAARDDDTAVVVRVDADPDRFTRIEIVGRDPFTAGERTLLAATAVGGAFDLRVPRRQFADYPRTEFRLWAKGGAVPALVVYYVGIPDTTPETTRADELDRSLAARLARAREAPPRRPP